MGREEDGASVMVRIAKVRQGMLLAYKDPIVVRTEGAPRQIVRYVLVAGQNDQCAAGRLEAVSFPGPEEVTDRLSLSGSGIEGRYLVGRTRLVDGLVAGYKLFK